MAAQSVCFFQPMISIAQCPANIGFEAGNFNHRQCSMVASADREITVNLLRRVGRHTLNDVTPHR